MWHTHGGIEVIQYASILFAILLHELGHCYVGRIYGFKIKHITLCPIGGIAAIDFGIPDPKSEFLMTAAGPITSLGLAALTFIPWYIFQDVPLGKPIGNFFDINMMLFGFNLLPGFPMDGGRILRSTLNWLWGDVLRATHVAATVGLVLSISFWLVGISFHKASLCLIAPIIALLAESEYLYLVRKVKEQDDAS